MLGSDRGCREVNAFVTGVRMRFIEGQHFSRDLKEVRK